MEPDGPLPVGGSHMIRAHFSFGQCHMTSPSKPVQRDQVTKHHFHFHGCQVIWTQFWYGGCHVPPQVDKGLIPTTHEKRLHLRGWSRVGSFSLRQISTRHGHKGCQMGHFRFCGVTFPTQLPVWRQTRVPSLTSGLAGVTRYAPTSGSAGVT